MKKKLYIIPTIQVVKVQQQSQILIGSPDIYGMNNLLQEEEPPLIIGW